MKGYVDVVFSKAQGQGKRYAFKIKNDDIWYSCGFKDPKIKKGDQIEFEFEQNGDFYNVSVEAIKILRSGPEVVEARRGFPKSVGSGAEKDTYWRDREARDIDTQKRIQLQASRNSAIALASVMLQSGAVKLPEAVAKRHEVVAALVQEWTEKFQEQVNGTDKPAVEAVPESTNEGAAMPEEWE